MDKYKFKPSHGVLVLQKKNATRTGEVSLTKGQKQDKAKRGPAMHTVCKRKHLNVIQKPYSNILELYKSIRL